MNIAVGCVEIGKVGDFPNATRSTLTISLPKVERSAQNLIDRDYSASRIATKIYMTIFIRIF